MPLRWSVRPPLLLLSGMAVLVAMAVASAAQWHWAAAVVVVVFILLWWRSGRAGAIVSGGVLGYRRGLWVYRTPGHCRVLQLRQAWPCALWVTLRFHDAGRGHPDVFTEVTIWKPGLPPRAWQQLCMHVAQDLQFPIGGQFDRT